MTLSEFLLARIAEDEAVARAEVQRVAGSARRGGKTAALRQARECEAKRRIVEWHTETEDCCEERYGPLELDPVPTLAAGTTWSGQLSVTESIGFQPYLGCVTLMHLATVYSDHTDFNPSWRV